MIFQYLAVNSSRERLEGEIRADTLEAATKKLQAQGHTVISLKPFAQQRSVRRFSDRLQILVEKLKNNVPLKNLVFFTRQLATMFSAGLTMERSFDILTQGEPHKPFKKILGRVSGDLKKGIALSEALARHPSVFSDLYSSLIKAGEVSGTLGTVLDRLAEHMEKTEDVRRKVVTALLYPVTVCIILAISVCILLLNIAPKFKAVYASFGAELPGPTLVLMNTSDFALRHIGLAFFTLVAGTAGLTAYLLTDQGRRFWDGLKIRMPLFGELIRNAVMVRVARTFSLLLSTSVPVLDALALVGRAATNVVIEQAIEKSRALIKKGSAINLALKEAAVFPALLVQLVATGEETGEIDKLLLRGAEFYEKQVDAFISRITSVIEPLLIILMAVVVGALVIVIWLPIFNLGIAIKKGLNQ